MKGVLLGAGKRHIGHNPGSAYAIFIMLALVLALATTGILMGQGYESLEELHEILAYVMVGVVVMHILGVLIHSIRHRENIIASMIHGKKEAGQSDAIRSSHPVVAIVFLAITAAWAFGLIRNYDDKTLTTQLPVFGASLQIGEAESDSGRRKESVDIRNRENDHDD
jgi:Ca2+/H+ antiporter